MTRRDVWRLRQCMADYWAMWAVEMREMLESCLLDMRPAKATYRPPTIPRQAQPWELQGQRVNINPVPAWQRCPQRHGYRESRARWQGVEEHG